MSGFGRFRRISTAGMATSERAGPAPHSGAGTVHLLAEAERTHVRPHFLDVGQALRLGAALGNLGPPEGQLTVDRPDRILLFVILHHAVRGRVFAFLCHAYPPDGSG